jgi:hypothetical protein
MDDRATIKDFETGRGRRYLVLVLAVLALVIVISSVVAGFRGRSAKRGARALTQPSAAKHEAAPAAPSIPSHM